MLLLPYGLHCSTFFCKYIMSSMSMMGNKARCISFLGLQMGFTWLSNAVPPQCSEHHARKAGALTQSYTHFQVTLQSFYQENYPDEQDYLCVSVVVPFLFLSTDLSTSFRDIFFVSAVSHTSPFLLVLRGAIPMSQQGTSGYP